MSGFPILDLVVGIIFIFFLLSIISSSVVEIALTLTRTRAKVLEDWFLQIFDKQIKDSKGNLVQLGRELLDHCSTTALSQQVAKGKTFAKATGPSYVDAKNFVSALLGKVVANLGKPTPAKITDIISALEKDTILPEELKQSFLLYAHEVEDTISSVTVKTTGAIEMFRGKLENWYDSNMDRLTGALKTLYTRRFTMASAIVLTLLLNADTIAISKYLYSNDEARAKLAAKAYETGDDENMKAEVAHLLDSAGQKDPAKIASAAKLDSIIKKRMTVIREADAALKQSIPLGWSLTQFAGVNGGGEWVLFILAKLVGMAVTVLALMMGAPFWFDVLNKISNLRGNGPKPASSSGDKK